MSSSGRRSIAIRIGVEGREDARAALNDLGTAGKKAFSDVAAGADQATASADKLHQKYLALAAAARQQQSQDESQRAFNAFMGIPAAGAANTNSAEQAAAVFTANFQKQTSAAQELNGAIGFLRSGLGLLGIAFSVESIVEFGKHVLETTAALKGQAAIAGVSVEALQAYQIALERGGASAEDAQNLLQHLTRSIGEARLAAGPARQALFDLFGDQASQVAALPTEQVIQRIAQALLRLPSAADRAAVEFKLFSRSGQDIEAGLRDIATGSGNLEEKFAALIRTTGDVDKANDALNRMNEAFMRLQTQAAPSVVWITDKLASLIEKVNEFDSKSLSQKIGEEARIAEALATGGLWGLYDYYASSKGGAPSTPMPKSVIAPVEVTPELNVLGGGFVSPTREEDAQKLPLQLQIAKETSEQQAIDNALIAAAEPIYRENSGNQKAIVTSLSQAKEILGPTLTAQITQLEVIKQQAAHQKQIKETLDQYLASLGEEARLAGLSTLERKEQEAVIKAAQVAQKAAGVDDDKQVKTYAEAFSYLKATGQEKAAQAVRDSVAQTSGAAFLRQQDDAMARIAAASGLVGAERQRVLLIEQGIESGLTREQATLEAQKILATQRADSYGQLIHTLDEEARLAGLTKDQRQIEKTIDDEIRAGAIERGSVEEQILRTKLEQNQAAQKQTEIQDELTDSLKSDTQGFIKSAILGKPDPKAFADAIENSVATAISKSLTEKLFGLFDRGSIGNPMFVTVTNPGGVAGGTGAPGGGDFFSSLLGGIGDLFSNNVLGTLSSGQADAVIAANPLLFHDGGVVGTTTARRAVDLRVFDGAPRHHLGLAPDERPAILQTGEEVRSRAQVAADRARGMSGRGDVHFHAGAIVIQTPDPRSFQGSTTQISSQLVRAVRRGMR